MIIACPACTTRYVVPDSAIGADGRTVRCAKCRHSWFQDGPRIEAPAAPPPPPPAPAIVEPAAPPAPVAPPQAAEEPAAAERTTDFDPQPPAAEAEPGGAFGAGPNGGTGADSPPEPELPPVYSAPEPPRPADDEPPIYAAANPGAVDVVFEQSPSSFEYEPPFRPRRNPAKLWTAAAIGFALVVAATIGAISYWGLPNWLPVARPAFGPAQPGLKLDFPPERQDRRTLPNGTEFFGASGSVTNVGAETRRVPAILIVLRDGRERIVYTWEVRPAKRELAPGESVTINEAVTDVPRSAKFAEIGWKR